MQDGWVPPRPLPEILREDSNERLRGGVDTGAKERSDDHTVTVTHPVTVCLANTTRQRVVPKFWVHTGVLPS